MSGADTATAKRSIGDRILDRVEVDPETGCWLWQGAIKSNGYGVIGWREDGRTRTFHVHRIAYALWNGEVPEGQHLDHICGIRRCANPNHLVARSQAEHNARHQTKTHCIHGHFKHGKRWCRECSRLRMRDKVRT